MFNRSIFPFGRPRSLGLEAPWASARSHLKAAAVEE
jgi:hypothetical protein